MWTTGWFIRALMSLPGPSGCRQSAPRIARHQGGAPVGHGPYSGTSPFTGMNPMENGSRSSGGTSRPLKSSAVGSRSAMVLYPVAFTNSSNRALVTSVLSIQNPVTATWCSGAFCSESSAVPIQNGPPGTHTIPFGVGPGGSVGCTNGSSDDGAGFRGLIRAIAVNPAAMTPSAISTGAGDWVSCGGWIGSRLRIVQGAGDGILSAHERPEPALVTRELGDALQVVKPTRLHQEPALEVQVSIHQRHEEVVHVVNAQVDRHARVQEFRHRGDRVVQRACHVQLLHAQSCRRADDHAHPGVLKEPDDPVLLDRRFRRNRNRVDRGDAPFQPVLDRLAGQHLRLVLIRVVLLIHVHVETLVLLAGDPHDHVQVLLWSRPILRRQPTHDVSH